jgi:surface polysaccharide O-acyltransferase-like enzyme
MNSESRVKKLLPKTLTSYDLLKTIALLLMLVDHTGHYFFPDENWFRIFGRLCVPIWFFLIGYARTREIAIPALIGVVLIGLGNIVAGETLFPLSILITLMIGRYYIDVWMRPARIGGEALAGLFFILFFLFFPTGLFMEYGTLGLLFTVMGGMCRYRQDYPVVREQGYDAQLRLYAIGSFAAFTIIQCIQMTYLDAPQFFTLIGGMIIVGIVLARFHMAELHNMTAALPKFAVGLLQLTGRRTLEIYVLHLLIFKGLAMIYDADRFQFMKWRWAPEGTIKIFDYLLKLL